MRSRPTALVLASIAALLFASSVAAAGPQEKRAVIVVFEHSVGHPRALAVKLTAAHGARPAFVYTHALKGFAATLPAAAIPALKADPWGHPYVYHPGGPGNGAAYRVLSMGPDGKEGTGDDILAGTVRLPAASTTPVSRPSGVGP